MKKKAILYLCFLILILACCKEKTSLDSLSQLNYVELINLKVEKDGNTFLFTDLQNGYYYFLTSRCEVCVDSDLSKIESYNRTSTKKIHVVLHDDLLFQRVMSFLNDTKLFKAQKSLSEFNYMLELKDNSVIYMTRLEDLVN